MRRMRVPVLIRADDGHTGGQGEIEIAQPPFRRRLGQAGLRVLLGLGIGILLLPVPLIHLFGIMFFLAMCGLAARRLIARTALMAAQGTCPSCHTTGRYFVGTGGKRLAFPILTSCPQCHVSLRLEPTTGSAQGVEPGGR